MRTVITRVSSASVTIEEQCVGRIERGLLALVGVATGDSSADAALLAEKLRFLRIFADGDGKMNLDVIQAGGAMLVVSNFTLLVDTRKGRRPAFTGAAEPALAEALYGELCDKLRNHGVKVETGRFRETMLVESVNDGPVTLILDTRAS
jgi:D-aminoacyl-tRNA deacylase